MSGEAVKVYIRAFVIGAAAVGLLGHFMTAEPMPWWPDTVIFSGFMGAMVAFGMLRIAPLRRLMARPWRRSKP
jgi:hypothetical protein